MTINKSQPALRFYFDYISPNAYLAWTQLSELMARHNATVELVPVLFTGLLRAHKQMGPAEQPVKSAWMSRNIARKAAMLNVPLMPPAHHPFNPLLVLRLSSVEMPADERWRLVDVLMRGIWAEGVHAGDEAAIRQLLQDNEFDADDLLAKANGDEPRASLRAQTEQAIAAGVFGIPTTQYADEMFFGYDDFPYLEMSLSGQDPINSSTQAQQWLDASWTASSQRREISEQKPASKSASKPAAAPIEVWTAPTPNGWKVAVLIEEMRELGLPLPPVTVHTVDLMAGEQLQPEYLAMNPNGRIPFLKHGDKTVFESCAILQYLAEQFPSPLLPANESRWQVLQWLYWQAASVGPAFGNRQSYMRYMDNVPDEQKAHPLARFLAEARRLAAIAEQQLEGRDYFCGDQITIADIAIYPWFRGWKWSKVDMTDRPNILAWMKRMRARPGVGRGLAWGAPEGEVDQWSESTKARYAKGGASIATENEY